MAKIKWHERDCKYLWEVALPDGNVCATLARCGLLKFMWITLMERLRMLLQTLVRFWDIGEEAFMIQGQRVEITLLDVYFLTGLPMLGFIGDLAPVLSHGEMLEELCDRHC